MIKGFKDFLLRGNVVDLAVAVVIGAAFTAVVTAFTESFLLPLIGLIGGGGSEGGTFSVSGQVFTYGRFINQVITFALTAAVVYFAVVLPMKAIMDRRRRGEETGPVAPTQVELLVQIRDLLQAHDAAAPTAADPQERSAKHLAGPGSTSLPGQL
ncbi:large conductance mechanosensitive channel protein MscL [Modestobacter sp. SSW1-42]|uniref:large conductance mechanosensitive channel protein MscL n=1 Tax=Modestobacter sp. SSW1-42 TaxID=596372 RepID=UPI003986196F